MSRMRNICMIFCRSSGVNTIKSMSDKAEPSCNDAPKKNDGSTMSVKPTQHMKRILQIADQVDDLYFQLYCEKCELEGTRPLGRPGTLGYDSQSAVLKHIRAREKQIEDLRAKIAALQEKPSMYVAEAEAIANFLGIKTNP